MKKILITETDFKDIPELADLVKRIDVIDPDYLTRASDDIFRHQPFFISLLLGYQNDLSLVQLAEITKIYFLVWEYFVPHGKLRNKRVSQAMYEEAQMRNIRMLEYSEGETSDSKKTIYSTELQYLKSKTLWAAVLHRYNTTPSLMSMTAEDKGMTLIAILSFIQCFERLS